MILKNLLRPGLLQGLKKIHTSAPIVIKGTSILGGDTKPLDQFNIKEQARLKPKPFENPFKPLTPPPVIVKREETPMEWVDRMSKWESLNSREKAITPEVSKKVQPASLMAHDVYGTDDSGPSLKKLEALGITPVRREDFPPELLKELRENGMSVSKDGRIEDFDTTPPHYIDFDGNPKLLTGEPMLYNPDNHVALKARVYTDEDGNLGLAIAGSSMSPFDGRGPKNWLATNLPNALGRVTGHDQRALELAQSLQKHSGGQLKLVTGHSLAGGTTKYLSGMVEGVEGVTFNGAGITKGHEKNMRERGVVPNSVNCTNVVSGDDIVTRLQKGSEIAQRVVDGIQGLSNTSGTPGPIFSTGEKTGHGMGDLVESIARKVEPEALKADAPKTEGPKKEGPKTEVPEGQEAPKTENSVVIHTPEMSGHGASHDVTPQLNIPLVYVDDRRRDRVQEADDLPELEEAVETPHLPTVRELMGKPKEIKPAQKETLGTSVKEVMKYDPESAKQSTGTKHKFNHE